VTPDEAPHRPRHPRLRWIGHALGLAYVLVTLLFGPIRSLARWLERQRIVQRYERRVARWPPAAGLALSLLSLGLLELSKVAVLLSYRSLGGWRPWGDLVRQGQRGVFRPRHLAGRPPEGHRDLCLGGAGGRLGRGAPGATPGLSRPVAGLSP